MSGFCIYGFVGRFAAAHFGQRNAGSPLNALMRAIQRFLARRAPPHPQPPARSPQADPSPVCGTQAAPLPPSPSPSPNFPLVRSPLALTGPARGTSTEASPLPSVLSPFPTFPLRS